MGDFKRIHRMDPEAEGFPKFLDVEGEVLIRADKFTARTIERVDSDSGKTDIFLFLILESDGEQFYAPLTPETAETMMIGCQEYIKNREDGNGQTH